MIIFPGKYFSPRKIYESGQVLIGWRALEKPGEVFYVASAGKNCVCGLAAEGDCVVIDCPEEDTGFWRNYFDLPSEAEKKYDLVQSDGCEDPYALAEKEIEDSGDDFLAAALEYGRGIRILRQDLWECMLSFIVSQNNNIPRITASVRKIQGDALSLPRPEDMYKTRERLSDCGLGYRDRYLIKLLEDLHEGTRNLEFSEDTDEARRQLLDITGIGPKVADCILLFGLHRMERCPVDTWMKKIFEKYYGGKPAPWTIGALAGYYQQLAFYYERTRDLK